jgi:hypothetical protein
MFSVIVGSDSSVGIVTRYELDGPGIESQWGRDFPHRLDRPWVSLCLPGVKLPGRGVDQLHLAPSLKKE